MPGRLAVARSQPRDGLEIESSQPRDGARFRARRLSAGDARAATRAAEHGRSGRGEGGLPVGFVRRAVQEAEEGDEEGVVRRMLRGE